MTLTVLLTVSVMIFLGVIFIVRQLYEKTVTVPLLTQPGVQRGSPGNVASGTIIPRCFAEFYW